jgi:hypothetical protein
LIIKEGKMKKFLTIIPLVILLCFLVCLCASTTLAQAKEQKAQLFMVEDISVLPSKVSDFEAHVKTIQKFANEYKFPYPIYVYNIDDYSYFYVIPVKDFADIDDFNKAKMEWIERMGQENLMSILKSGEGSYKHLRWFIIRHRPDLSYTSDKPRFKPEEANFMSIPLCYVKPGKEREFEEICKEWVLHDKSVNRADSYDTFVGDIGTEMPFYFWVARAKSAADFHKQQEIYGTKAGEKFMELWNRTMALFRKYDEKTGWFRPDLSYILKEK